MSWLKRFSRKEKLDDKSKKRQKEKQQGIDYPWVTHFSMPQDELAQHLQEHNRIREEEAQRRREQERQELRNQWDYWVNLQREENQRLMRLQQEAEERFRNQVIFGMPVIDPGLVWNLGAYQEPIIPKVKATKRNLPDWF